MQRRQERRIMVNGQVYLMPGEVMTGEGVKDAAAIDPLRNLIRQAPDGNEIVPDDQQLHLADGDYFSDAPTFKYG